jgi:lysophospholipase L1-like esterase
MMLIKILLVGDSLSLYPGGYQTHINSNVTNLSKVGKSTSYMLNVINEHKKEIKGYKHVIFYGGVNDVYGGVNQRVTLNNIQRAVDTVRKYGGNMIVIIGYNPLIQPNKAKANEWRDLQTKIATEIKGARIVPMCPYLLPKHLSDNVHLNTEGNKIFGDWIKSQLKNRLLTN